MSEKLCVFCNHLDVETAYDTGYYEGDCYPSADIGCKKNHWHIGVGGDGFVRFNRSELADAIQTAKTCKDYDEAKP